MNKVIFDWYKATKQLIKEAKECPELKDQINEWNSALQTMERGCVGLKEAYERYVVITQSFTEEQLSFFCSQIDHWYYEWKDKLICDYEQKTHRLGMAKEDLKKMLCGE